MKLNKKYFSAIFPALGIQLVWGINLANANPCEAEITTYCSTRNAHGYTLDGNFCSNPERTHIEMNAQINSTLQSFEFDGGIEPSIKNHEKYRNLNESRHPHPVKTAQGEMLSCFLKTSVCLNDKGVKSQNSNTFTDYKGCDGSSQATISNQQTTKNQSNQSNATSSGSASSDQSSQLNSSAEDMERSNIKNYYAEKTAAYEQKYQGRGKKHNHGAVANQCIKTKGRKVLNICDFDVEAVFCAVNPDPDSIHAFEMANGLNCARNSIGMWPILGRKSLSGVFTAESVSVFACKKPSHPSGAVYDHQKQVIVARCSEY